MNALLAYIHIGWLFVSSSILCFVGDLSISYRYGEITHTYVQNCFPFPTELVFAAYIDIHIVQSHG